MKSSGFITNQNRRDAPRRFPPPWSATSVAKPLTSDAAKRIPADVAKLPELLRKPRTTT